MIKKGLLLLGLMVIPVAVIMGITKQESFPIQKQTRFLMDTICVIQVPGDNEVLKSIERAFARIEEIDSKFNSMNPESPVYAFNNNNIPITDEEIVNLVKTSFDMSEKSSGSFDVTVFPLIELWGFFGESPDLPSQNDIYESLKNVGYKNLDIKDGKLIKYNQNTKIDFGAIAKGYAVSEALKELKMAGIESALIDAGGDIYALGTNNGKPWKVGIKNPRGDGVIGVLELTDKTVITSGDYERYFEKEGVRYNHILDPQTGYSSQGTASVTVISNDPVVADAWSTALFIMGKEKGLELMKNNNSIEVLMITSDGEKYYSSDMQVKTKIVKGN